MENVLQRLLDAELKAQDIVEQAKKQRDRLVSEAREEVARAEQRFQARIPEIHSAFMDKAEEKAQTHIKELERRYEERRQSLKKIALEGEQQAIDDILQIILDVENH